MAQSDSLGSSAARDARPDRVLAPSATPQLRAVVRGNFEPAAVDVLMIGNQTRTLVSLAGALGTDALRSRTTLDTEEIFHCSARQLPKIVVIDDEAAEVDGLELIGNLSKNPRLRDIPVVLVSACSDLARKVEAFSAGVVDYVVLPCEVEELHSRVAAHLRIREAQLESEQHSHLLESFVLEQVSEITDSQMATILALAKLAESRDYQTGGHLERVQRYCRLIATKLSEQIRFGIIDQTFLDNIEYASALHDIGKVAISDVILLKPSELTPHEFELMKAHTVLGAKTLESVSHEYPNNDFVAMGIKIARWHHERWDGSGYPDGLAGEEIPLCARIMAVADVYDALTSHRTYKSAIEHLESREIIVAESGGHFDPAVVEAFVAVAERFMDADQLD
jgi:putative two-component system response regulator